MDAVVAGGEDVPDQEEVKSPEEAEERVVDGNKETTMTAASNEANCVGDKDDSNPGEVKTETSAEKEAKCDNTDFPKSNNVDISQSNDINLPKSDDTILQKSDDTDLSNSNDTNLPKIGNTDLPKSENTDLAANLQEQLARLACLDPLAVTHHHCPLKFNRLH